MMSASTPPPILLLVSAPSGAGKTTLCQRLLAEFPSLRYSISCTTRPPRAGEVHDVHYTFMSRAEFLELADVGAFLEYAEVYGNYYGTRTSAVRQAMAEGQHVLMDVDVQGAEQIREALKKPGADPLLRQGFVDVFVTPPSLEELNARLVARAQDSAEVIARRMDNAAREMEQMRRYQYLVLNDNLETAYDVLRAIFLASQHEVSRSCLKN